MKNKKIFIPLLLILLAVIIVGIIIYPKKKEPEVIKIGAILPLTGPAALYGNDALKGIQLAIDQIESSKEKKYKYTFIVEDSKSSPKDGVNAFRKLIEIHNVKVIIGDILSSVVLSIAPIANSKKVLVFAPGASTPELDRKEDYVFRNWISDAFDAMAIASYSFEKLGIKSVVIFFVNNDYGRTLAKSFEEHFFKKNGKILLKESFNENDRDFKSLIIKAKNLSPDAYYIIGYANQTGMLVKQLGELKALENSIVLCNLSAEDPEFYETAGKFATKVIYSSPAFDIDNPKGPAANFIESFRKKFGKDPGIASAHSYDAAILLWEIIEKVGYDVGKIKESLGNINTYPGVSGLTTIDRYGDASKEIFIKTLYYKEGKWTKKIMDRFLKN